MERKMTINTSKYILFIVFFSTTLFAQSPYETSWKKESWVMGGSLGISFLAASLDDSLHALTSTEIAALNNNEINIFDRWATNFASENISKSSDILIAGCIAAPLGVMLADSKMRNDWGSITTMYVETALLATFIPSFGKGTVKRVRPFMYNPDASPTLRGDVEGNRSFFSGHTTWAFASMTFLATVYSDYYPNSKYKSAVWISTMSAASAVGLLRIFSGAHFPSDVLVGAVVGSAIGIGIPYLHKVENTNVSILPNADANQASISFQILF